MCGEVRVARIANAVASGAAALLVFLCGTALAAQGDPPGGARLGVRRAPVVADSARNRGERDADKYAMCGKCHSACENGRSHEGRPTADGQRGAGLPLDDEGRATCATCHDAGRHDAPGETGARLRMSNVRRELCLACHRRDAEPAPRIEIVSPREGAVVNEQHLALIGTARRLPAADLTVRLNGAEFHLQVKGGEFSTWLRLQDGVNRIEVAQEQSLLWSGEVFLGESPMGGYERASSGHRTGTRAQCLECHRKKDELRSAGRAATLCYGCHDRVGEKRYVHGPLAVGDCLACHDPHGGYGAAHLRQEQALLCANCHAARGDAATVACNASGRGCVSCHDPHQSDTRYLLKGPQYTMR